MGNPTKSTVQGKKTLSLCPKVHYCSRFAQYGEMWHGQGVVTASGRNANATGKEFDGEGPIQVGTTRYSPKDIDAWVER